jgi:hypothetical protein
MKNVKESANFIWSIADLLRGDYKQSDYGKVILPLTVLRRLDCVLETTKEDVLKKFDQLKTTSIENLDPILNKSAGYNFHNRSQFDFNKLIADPNNIAANLRNYINGFSEDAREIIEQFEFENQINKMDEANLLFMVVKRFQEIDLHPDHISSMEMGYMFEELIRKFAEISNETAGEHFTPREVIRLMVNILFLNDREILTTKGITKTMFDCCAGTGGILSVAEEYLNELNPDARLEVFGQELNPESYAICMHELVHLDFVIQARKENLNQVFLSTQKNKQDFLTTIQPAIHKLKSMGVEETMITKFTDGIFNGINLQTYNTPIDMFIEDLLYKEYAELRSYQFLSLFNLLQEAIKAVTDTRILDIAPQSVLSKTKTYSLVNAMQFKELFGIDLIPEFKASTAELKQAQSFFNDFSEIKDDRKAGQEFELVKHWAQELGLDNFFELESETKFETKNNIDDFLTKLQQDPFGLDEEEDPLEKREMQKFQKHQEEMGTNMAIVMFMVDALKYFKNKAAEDIKQTALEIAMLGTMGIDPNKKEYIIASITGKRFSGNQVLAYYYVSWAIAMPEQVQHLGLDFKTEYEMAKKTI